VKSSHTVARKGKLLPRDTGPLGKRMEKLAAENANRKPKGIDLRRFSLLRDIKEFLDAVADPSAATAFDLATVSEIAFRNVKALLDCYALADVGMAASHSTFPYPILETAIDAAKLQLEIAQAANEALASLHGFKA
jgi:hypothetical protein